MVTPQTTAPATAATAGETAAAQYELSQRFFFDAAHSLHRAVDDAAEIESSRRIHGHTYEAEVTVRGLPDPTSGMLIDLGFLRSEIARVRDRLDHRLLDEVEGIGPATLENLCAYIRKQLEPAVPCLCAVMVERRTSGDRCVLRWE